MSEQTFVDRAVEQTDEEVRRRRILKLQHPEHERWGPGGRDLVEALDLRIACLERRIAWLEGAVTSLGARPVVEGVPA